MPCDGAIEPLDGTGDGSVTALSVTASGQITLLSCCDDPPTQEQALAKHWKKTRADLFTTVPLKFGRVAFTTYGTVDIAGPTKPGEDGRYSNPNLVIIQPPADITNPDGMPVNPGASD